MQRLIVEDTPNRSNDRLWKNSPLAKSLSFFSCFKMNSRFVGSFITTAGGRVGTDIWNVSKPNLRSHATNQAKRLWRARMNTRPFPTSGTVFGGHLYRIISLRVKLEQLHETICCIEFQIGQMLAAQWVHTRNAVPQRLTITFNSFNCEQVIKSKACKRDENQRRRRMHCKGR